MVYFCVVAACASAQGAENDKIDRGLQASLRSGAATQHVIISLKPGFLATARKALTDHGDRVKADHPLIGAVSAEIHSGDVGELAKQPWVDSVSLDATVYAVADKQPARARGGSSFGQGRALVSPSVNLLREAVGLSSAASTSRVRHRRCRDRLRGWPSATTCPGMDRRFLRLHRHPLCGPVRDRAVRRLRSRHARRWLDWQQRRVVGQSIQESRPMSPLSASKCWTAAARARRAM